MPYFLKIHKCFSEEQLHKYSARVNCLPKQTVREADVENSFLKSKHGSLYFIVIVHH